MLDLNHFNIEFECPKCKYLINIQLIEVKIENIVFCHNCKTSIRLKDNHASSHKGIKDVNNAMNELKKTIKKLGK